MARPAETDRATAKVLAELERVGLLLQAGKEFPSVANLVAGETISGSWWAHPQSNLIYWVCQDLEEHPRVAEARLIAGKVTQLWDTVRADVVAIALARDDWQWRGVDASLRALVNRVDASPQRTDQMDWSGPRKLGDACRLLEQRLLIRSDEVHTDSGRHAKVLTSWEAWWAPRATGALPDPREARLRLENRLGDAARWLPWMPNRIPGRQS
jgi:hypothetical protein